ncbi:hypothetical protein [Methylobacterium sp. XJLW]|jgi:hypothetical protein|uniref:hypothetical protein n=1 Tax=Methylobacterium sp. XJLW TaxID=739141 RepID=UPI0013E0B4C8|nr:hypothetical protein [Methylobacterium sp. XJLW]
MPLLYAAALLAALSTCAQAAAPRHHRPRAVSVPVFIEGVGTVWISARPARARH